jgi:two-component system cell cycle response regulator
VRILLAEDSAIDRHLISGFLGDWQLEHTVAEDGVTAWELLQGSDPPNLALLDWVLPGMDGLEICRRVRTLGSCGTYIYVVMLTAKDRKQHLLAAMEAGADDYLAKPVDSSELRARILAGKRILDLQQSLRFAATHDFLTGLLNRAEILAALARELSRSQREGRPVGVILADLDHFKEVNDTLGHAAGDAVLNEVAHSLRSDLRLYDVAGRLGGEEFLLLLPGCDLHTAARRAEEIRCRVAKQQIATPTGVRSVTVSMGVAVSTGNFRETIESVLQQADQALYRAKSAGRNCVQVRSRTARSGAR